MKKSLLLYFLFPIPISLFFFFRFFAENEFKVPVYYEETIPDLPSTCLIDYPVPYTVLNQSQLRLKGVTVVAFINHLDNKQHQKIMNWYEDILSMFTEDTIFWLSIYSDHVPPFFVGNTKILNPISYRTEKECYYLSADHVMVLVDEKRRIRGYYADASFEEMNRLMAELTILTQNN